MKFLKIFFIFILISCSQLTPPQNPSHPKDFQAGEIINANELLTKIFEQQTATIDCVPSIDEASLLLRTLSPRMELVQDDFEALLDDEGKVTGLIKECDLHCTCGLIDDLIREHMVPLDKKLKRLLDHHIRNSTNRVCMNQFKEKFCQSDLYRTINQEKEDFTYQE
jgi:hypothetical protein